MNPKRDTRPTIAILIALLALGISLSALLISARARARADLVYNSSPFVEGSPARENAQRNADRIRSGVNARSLSMAVLVHARNHGNQAPSPDNWKQALIDGDLTSDLIFVPPETAAPVDHPYHYIPPTPEQVRAMSTSGSSKIVVIYEHPGLWGGQGGNVAYLDTSTEWIEGDAYRELVERLRAQD